MGLATIRGDLSTAVDGGSQLVDGATTLSSGAASAQDGAGTLADGAARLADGASSLADGTAQVAGGVQQLADGSGTLDAGLQQLRGATAALPAQTATLAEGAAQVAAGDSALAAQADAVGAASQQAADSVPVIRGGIEASLQESGLDPARIAEVLALLDPLGDDTLAANAQAQGQVALIDRLAGGATRSRPASRAGGRRIASRPRPSSAPQPRPASAATAATRGAARRPCATDSATSPRLGDLKHAPRRARGRRGRDPRPLSPSSRRRRRPPSPIRWPWTGASHLGRHVRRRPRAVLRRASPPGSASTPCS